MRQSGTGELGFFRLRDHSPVEVPKRDVLGGVQGEDRGLDPEGRSLSAGSYGDIQGGMLWREVDGQRDYTHVWFLAGPSLFSNTKQGTAVAGADKAWSLQFDATNRDERLETKDLNTPDWFHGRWPNSHPALGSVGTKEDEQVDLLHPSFFGLFAPQQHGPAECGTPIYDLDDEAKPDKERQVTLQQLVRVANLGAGVCGFGGYVPALQLGRDSLDGKPGGLAMADGVATGLGTAAAGGPFTLGVGQCVHQTAGPDGPMGPVHLATSSLFLGLEHDGQLHFEPDIVDWVGMRDEGVPSRVHLAWEPTLPTVAGCQRSAGRWVWYTRQSHFIGEPPPPPRQPPPDDPPPFLPPPVTGGDPTGVLLDPFTQGGAGVDLDFVTGVGLGDGAKTGLVSDGSKMVHATSPYCQAAPCFIGKPQDPTFGAVHAYDNVAGYAEKSPTVAKLAAYGSHNSDGFVKTDGTATSHPVGQGGFALIPPDVDQFAVFRGETVTTSYTAQFAVPTGLAEIALGTVGTNGLVGTGMTITPDGSGGIDFNTLDSSGVVTATANLANGSTTLGVGGATGAADNALLRADGTGGSTVQATGILVNDSDVMTSVTGIGLTNQSGDPFGGASTGLFVDNSDGTARPSWAISGTEYSIPFVSLSGINDGDVPAWSTSGNTWTASTVSGLPATAGAYSFVQRNSGDTAWASTLQLDARNDPNSASWANPGHFIQNTDNQTSAQDLPVLELAMPNHTYNGAGTGGAGLSFTGQGGTPTGGMSGRRTGSLSGDLYAGGTTGGVPSYTGRFWSNYSSTDGFTVEGDGMITLVDTITGSDPNPFSSNSKIYTKDGDLWGRNVGGDPFAIGPTAGEAITGLADDGIHEFGEGYVSYEQTLPTSGSAAVTISNVIRAPSLVDDVSVVIKTAIPTTGGITSIQVGDGTTAARFGTFTTFAKNDSTTWEDWASETPPIANTTSGATDVVLTPVGGTWDAPAGVVVIGVRSGYVTLATYA